MIVNDEQGLPSMEGPPPVAKGCQQNAFALPLLCPRVDAPRIPLNGVYDIYSIPLDSDLGERQRYWAKLDPAARSAIERLKVGRHREAKLVARARLRELLGLICGLEPWSLTLSSGPFGKPLLDEAVPLTFNASDSHDRLVVVIASHGDIGIDIEAPREFAWERLVRRRFSPAENDAFDDLSLEDERRLFALIGWNRREAYGKAIGVGINFPMREVDVASELPRPMLCFDYQNQSPWWVNTWFAENDNWYLSVCSRPGLRFGRYQDYGIDQWRELANH
ncbi:4'-phosphopantetheinyl transferase superfamily protein [Gammaproteobacteria bacterium]|nr:4'-phosphopantetheinyl transferase superfamily protein [Gammaproteobacteria bacterium]